MAARLPTVEYTTGRPRVTRVDIKRGDAIDQIKITYDDRSEWTSGHDGGKSDGRALILASGEYIVEVVHEQFENLKCAAAGIKFKTNKHRTFKYQPSAMTTQFETECTSIKASAGHEIIALFISRGVLKGSEQQPVPAQEQVEHPTTWISIASQGAAEGPPVYRHFSSLKAAREVWHTETVPALRAKPGRAAFLIDCIKLRPLKRAGAEAEMLRLKEEATAAGLLAGSNEDETSMFDAICTLFRVINQSEDANVGRRDAAMLLLTMSLLAASFYLELQAHLLTGSVLSVAAGSNSSASDEQSWVLQLTCDSLRFACDSSQDELRKALIAAFVMCQVAKCAFYVANVYFHHNACDEKNHRMRITAFNHVLSLDQPFFDTNSISEIRGSMNVHAINNLITWNIPYLVTLSLKAFMIAYFLLQLNLQLGAIAVGAMLFIKFGVLDPMNGFERRTHKVQRKLDTLNNQIVDEVFSMASCVKMFAKEGRHSQEHDSAQRRYIANINQVVVYRCVREFSYGVLKVLIFGLCLWVAPTVFAEAKRVTTSELTGFFLLLTEFQDIFGRIKSHFEILVREFADIDRFLTLMQHEPTIVDGSIKLSELEGSIEFRNVHFEYPTRPGERVLKGLDLSIAPHKTTAIVGGSGAGKSTLSKLLMRLYDPVEGQVLVDGHDLKTLDGKRFRDQIGIVMQNPELFHMSIGENISYGAVDDKYDADQVQRAADLANCGFISRFRGGLDTTAGTRGGSLSGGEKQRLAIARAAIRNPKILILDEATSALDAENEQLCKVALQRLMAGRTTVVIAHRLSTIRDADDIVCMANGAVAERGTHDELMALNGSYAALVRKQVFEEETKEHSGSCSSSCSGSPKSTVRKQLVKREN